eukprot:SAG22_NODE_230_length_14595_cov_50.767660_11_plen_73_part_00
MECYNFTSYIDDIHGWCGNDLNNVITQHQPNIPLAEKNETPKKEKKKNNRRKLNPKLLSVLDNKHAKQKASK